MEVFIKCIHRLNKTIRKNGKLIANKAQQLARVNRTVLRHVKDQKHNNCLNKN